MSESTGSWEVGVVWLTRRLRRPDRMLRQRWTAAHRRKDGNRARSSRDTLDVLDAGCIDVDSVSAAIAIIAIVAIVTGFAALGPGLLAITVGLLEVAFVLVAAVAAVAARVLFGQPWEIVARRPGAHVEWRVAGARRARRTARSIERQLSQGISPDLIEPGLRDPDPPPIDAMPNLYRTDEFRYVGRFFGVLLAVASIVGVALLLAR